MKTTYKLFNIFGIPITVDLSVLILVFILITNFGDPFFGIVAGVILLLSILLHELGHSLVGMAFGGKVHEIRLLMLGGCASIAGMPKKAWKESLMAFAGPFVSLMIVVLSFSVLYFCFIPYKENPELTIKVILFEVSPSWAYNPLGSKAPFVLFLLSYAAWLNIILFIFNMIPAFPMDGGRILRATLQQFFTTRLRATWIASRIGRFLAILFGIRVLYLVLTSGFYNFALIQLFIAYMIYQAAEREYQMVLAEEQGPRRNPFGFPFFGQRRNAPPPDDGQAVVSPPPYQSRGSTRVDVHKED